MGGQKGRVLKTRKKETMQRQALLTGLAHENWEEFVVEWERQMLCWLQEIREAVKNPMAERPAYDIIDEAQNMLRMCGERAFKEYGVRTTEMLLEPVEELVRGCFEWTWRD